MDEIMKPAIQQSLQQFLNSLAELIGFTDCRFSALVMQFEADAQVSSFEHSAQLHIDDAVSPLWCAGDRQVFAAYQNMLSTVHGVRAGEAASPKPMLKTEYFVVFLYDNALFKNLSLSDAGRLQAELSGKPEKCKAILVHELSYIDKLCARRKRLGLRV